MSHLITVKPVGSTFHASGTWALASAPTEAGAAKLIAKELSSSSRQLIAVKTSHKDYAACYISQMVCPDGETVLSHFIFSNVIRGL